MSDFEEWFILTDESRSPELKEPMRIAYEAGVAKATIGNEFYRLGQAIGDAIHRLPPDYKIEIDLMNSGPFICLTDPDLTGIDFGHAGKPLADEIAKAVDAAIEDEKRRVSDE